MRPLRLIHSKSESEINLERRKLQLRLNLKKARNSHKFKLNKTPINFNLIRNVFKFVLGVL